MAKNNKVKSAGPLADKLAVALGAKPTATVSAPVAPAATLSPSNTPAVSAGVAGQQTVSAPASPRMGKGRTNALKLMAMLENGPVTKSQCATIDAKYPCDPPYYARLLYKVDIVTTRGKGQETTYSLRVPAPAPAAPKL